MTRAIILVTGDREWNNTDVIAEKLSAFPEGSKLIHGAARGADTICGQCAELLGFEISVYPYLSEYGKAGGPIRNIQMVDENPDITIVLAFHDDIENSRGTKHMLSVCLKRGIPFKLFNNAGVEVQVTAEMLKPKKKAVH